MPNVVIKGYGYRRTGTVNRPAVELTTPLDVDFIHLAVADSEIVPESIFEVEIELLDSPDLEVHFESLLEAEGEAETVTEGESS